MNVYISKVNGLSLESPLQYKQWLVADIAWAKLPGDGNILL